MPLDDASTSCTPFLQNPFRSPSESLHLFFLAFALPLVVYLSIYTPPLQSPDEPWHFEQSYLVAHGELFAARGGPVDSSIPSLWAIVSNLPHNPHEFYTASTQRAAEQVQWTGILVPSEANNIAFYPPTGYVPQAVAVLAGQLLGISVLHTLVLARLLNGIAAIAICMWALFVCRQGRVVMFLILLFPMTLSLFASASQDALLVAFGALAFALISRQLARGVAFSRRELLLVVFLILLASLARPTYWALTAALLAPGLLPDNRKRKALWVWLALAVSTFVITCAWWIAAMSEARGFSKPYAVIGHADAKLQLHFLLHHIGIVAYLLAYMAKDIFYQIVSLIGVLNWADTAMPSFYYLAMMALLILAMIAELHEKKSTSWRAFLLFLVGPVLIYFSMYFIHYLTWTPVGADAIYGPSGRYWTLPCIAAAVGIPCIGDSRQTYRRATAIVVGAQLLTCVCLPYALYVRYYAH